MNNLHKMQAEVAAREPRTQDAKVIREQQLVMLEEIESKLASNITAIEQKTPYIQVKHVVDKLY